jgi:predicted RNA-binding protein YlqC (UPF0109 family)
MAATDLAIATTNVPAAKPDYEALARFLLEPFLESSASLKLDCETSSDKLRIWIRVAFNGEDKGRVLGRGGRNIQAVRAVLSAIAQSVGQSVHLDIFGTNERDKEVRYSSGRSSSR